MIRINNVAIGDEQIAAEAMHHPDAPDPHAAAACALAIRELLLQRARMCGLSSEGGLDACDAVIEDLLQLEVHIPEPTEEECRRFYDNHSQQFVAAELVQAAHILFAVTPNAPVEAIRRQAEATLGQLIQAPERFAEFAARLSNCPSGAQGGNLGQVQPGQLVPEFEHALFAAKPGILSRLVNSRYGFHIVRIDRRIEGRRLPFEATRGGIARALSARVRAKATEQYVRTLAAEADITGLDLAAASSPLLQ
ncbi:MAG: peptidylprolyl isomerase [Rhodospirillaceae bacterium]